ncbi:hypothetical protein AB1L42_01505 [Thalassoglobus sp. JC818]|uniref:hypothetical protein n=1 Tax=Thalassoglobus sp. JC818 TaxID=3232136 RepID=UPI0034577961
MSMSQISATDATALTRSRKNAIDEDPDIKSDVLHQSQEKPSANLQQKLDDQINHPLKSKQEKGGLELAKDLRESHGNLKAKHQDLVNGYNNLVDQFKGNVVDNDQLTDEDIEELLRDLEYLEAPAYEQNDFTRPRSGHVDISQRANTSTAEEPPSGDSHASQQSDPRLSVDKGDHLSRKSIADENQFFDFIDSLVEENESGNSIDRSRLDSQLSTHTQDDSGPQQPLESQPTKNEVDRPNVEAEKNLAPTSKTDESNQSPQIDDQSGPKTNAKSDTVNSSATNPTNHAKSNDTSDASEVRSNVVVVSTAVRKPSEDDIKAAANEAGGVIASRIEDAAKGPSGSKVEIPMEAIGKFLNGSPGLGWRPQIQKGPDKNELIRTDPSNPKTKHVQFHVSEDGNLVLKIIGKNINWTKRVAAEKGSGGGLVPKNNGDDLDFTFQFSQKACSKAFNHKTTLSDEVLKNVRFSSCELTNTGLVLTKK